MDIFIINDHDADRLLNHVERWVRRLKELNVPADIATDTAYRFLAPRTEQSAPAPETRMTNAVSQLYFEPPDHIGD